MKLLRKIAPAAAGDSTGNRACSAVVTDDTGNAP